MLCEINRHTNSNELFNDNVTLVSFEKIPVTCYSWVRYRPTEFHSYEIFLSCINPENLITDMINHHAANVPCQLSK